MPSVNSTIFTQFEHFTQLLKARALPRSQVAAPVFYYIKNFISSLDWPLSALRSSTPILDLYTPINIVAFRNL